MRMLPERVNHSEKRVTWLGYAIMNKESVREVNGQKVGCLAEGATSTRTTQSKFIR